MELPETPTSTSTRRATTSGSWHCCYTSYLATMRVAKGVAESLRSPVGRGMLEFFTESVWQVWRCGGMRDIAGKNVKQFQLMFAASVPVSLLDACWCSPELLLCARFISARTVYCKWFPTIRWQSRCDLLHCCGSSGHVRFAKVVRFQDVAMTLSAKPCSLHGRTAPRTRYTRYQVQSTR